MSCLSRLFGWKERELVRVCTSSLTDWLTDLMQEFGLAAQLKKVGVCVLLGLVGQLHFACVCSRMQPLIRTLRRMASDHIRIHPDDFAPFLMSEQGDLLTPGTVRQLSSPWVVFLLNNRNLAQTSLISTARPSQVCCRSVFISFLLCSLHQDAVFITPCM